MEVLSTAREFGDSVGSLARDGLKAAGGVVFVGFVLVLFGAPTYYNVVGGDYVEAAVGAAVLLAFGAGVLWWVHTRTGLDVPLPSAVATPDEGN